MKKIDKLQKFYARGLASLLYMAIRYHGNFCERYCTNKRGKLQPLDIDA